MGRTILIRRERVTYGVPLADSPFPYLWHSDRSKSGLRAYFYSFPAEYLSITSARLSKAHTRLGEPR